MKQFSLGKGCRRVNRGAPRPAYFRGSRSGLLASFFGVAFFLLILVTRLLAQNSQIRITELMAVNNTVLQDEDGAYSDWIEIYNGGTNIVDLGGWYLASSAANLTKWMFPSTNLPPNQFLIVFASNKDRRVPGAPLHTNFKLSASGEYLALVQPDGVTKTSEFAPSFPPQYSDISYGYVMTGAVATLVAPDASVRALAPRSDLGSGWRFTGFNDSAWSAGKLGVGFDVFGAYSTAIGLDLRASMLNSNASAFIRVPFPGVNSNLFNSLSLRLRYDDGFVAYLNGTAISSRNAPASPSWNSTATATHGAPPPGFLSQTFEDTSSNYTLTQFGEAPAPAVQPADAGSTGKFLRLLYDGSGGLGNSVTFSQTAPGLFQTVTAEFDFRVASAGNNPADGFSFLLIPTSLYGTNGPGVNVTSSAAEEPNYAGVFAVGFDVYPHSERNDVSVHWNRSEMVNVTIPTATLDLAAGVFHHAKITLQHVTGGARVTVTLTPNINGEPVKQYTPISDFYVSGLNPFDCRVQFGGRTGGLTLALDIDNCDVRFFPPSGEIAYEDFDITSAMPRLQPGTNLLAIHGLNISPGNSNFLIQPQLLASRLTLAPTPGFLYPPTPGTWNAGATALSVPEVSFYPAPGVWPSNSLSVALASSSSSAIIRYTLDGAQPGPGSAIYTNPIVVTGSATIRAQAELNGLPGEIVAGSYFLLDQSLTNFTSNLPLVIVDTLGQPIPDGDKIPAYACFIDTNTPTGRTSLRSPPDYSGRLGVSYHGFSSLGFPKKPLAIELQDESGRDLEEGLLGMPADSDWLLYPSYTDKSLMNNVLTQEIFESMGHYAVRRRYVELFLHGVPGRLTSADYHGIYVLLERIRIDKNRVDIAKLAPSDNLAPEVTGGYLFERDRPEATDLTFTTPTGQQLIILEPRANEITSAQYDYLKGYVGQLETALYGPDWRNPVTGYAAYLDPDSFVDFHWIVEYPKNIDGVRLSNHLYKDRDGRIKDEPIWDWDLSWGNADYAEGGKTNGWYYPLMGATDDMWLSRLRTDPDFYQKIIDRWGALRSTVFSPSNLFARIDRITNQLNEAQAREFARWPRLGTYVWPNPNGAAGGWDVDYVSPTTYGGIVAEVKKYVSGRFNWIDSQFLRAPSITTNGTVLSLSAPAGGIYFTLDGTDPRASGGGLSAAARLYSGPVTLTTNAGIFARALQSSSWSPPARAVYVNKMPSLRITEINYHPAAPPTNSLYSEEDFEFLEVQNTGIEVLNLAGARIGGGVSFTFAPNRLSNTGSVTTNNFSAAGTPYTLSRLGATPGPYLTNGPAGAMLALLNSGTSTNRNRITFDQSAGAACDRIVAEFDFRTATTGGSSSNRPSTVQNFDSAGSAYTTAYAGSTAPAVLPAETGSSGSFLRLVPALTGQAARIGFDRTATGTVASIVTTFDFRVTAPPGQVAADGFSFALLKTATYGTTGAGPAFGEEPNLTGSIGIGFDVYNNASTAVEPNNNHLSLHWNGAQVGNAYIPSFNLSDGNFHRAQIMVAFAGNNAYVTVRLTPNVNGTPGPTQTVLQNVQISGIAPYESRVAFGARTGGAWAAHDLDNINVQYITGNLSLSSGLSLLCLPSSQFGVAGAGTTLSSFTDLPLVTNTLAVDLSFNPSNTVNDFSFYWDAKLASSVSLSPALADLDSGRFFHLRLQLDKSAGDGVLAAVDLIPDSLGVPGTPITVVSNLFISGARLDGSRLEFAARNGGLSSRVELDNVLASYQVLEPMLLNPGESILVVRNEQAFISRYGAGFRIAGEFSGKLGNDGDRLLLLGPLGEVILDFRYEPDWYPITDGAGFSLVAINPYAAATNWGLAANWRVSSKPLGSPGVVDPTPSTVAPVCVNEILSYPAPPGIDLVELWNPNVTNVNIGGWYLSDSFTQPQKFRIPPDTVVAPGGVVVFSEADFNAPGALNAFALDGQGDQLWLFSANADGDLTGYFHGFDFDAADEDVSFGRFLNSVGSEHFVAEKVNSFQNTNAGPRVGPLVMSEIMYAPAPTGANTNDFLQYIELENISAVPVPLFSLSLPNRTWSLRDAVDFDFPPNLVLGPGKRLLIVGFDPVTDSAGLAAFRTAYPSTTNATLIGPWQGRLSDADERIELRKPGPLTPAGDVPSVLVEAVHYRSSDPWPVAAAGQGSSLQRRLLSAYGNDPVNWFADRSSPGATNTVNQPPLVSLIAPANGQKVLYPDNLWITAAASDPDGTVAKVEFFADGIRLGEDTNAPFAFLWSAPAIGTHTIAAVARDNAGNATPSAPITLFVSPPSLSVFPAPSGLDLAWPTNSGVYSVQMTTNLFPPAVWLPLTNSPVLSGDTWRVRVLPITNQSSFYRLKAQ